MDGLATPALPPLRRGNFVLLRADALWLMFPQHEVGAVEYLDAVPIAGFDPPWRHLQAGTDGGRHLLALSSGLRPLDAFPADRVLMTALAGSPIGWCWNEIKVLIDTAVQPRPIPPVLHAPGMALAEYVEFDAGLAFVCSAQALCAHVAWHEERVR